MTIKIWNDFLSGGFVMLNYSILCSLELVSAIVLCQIIAEYNHAHNKNLNLDKFFLVNLSRMSDYLYFDEECIVNALKELKNLDLIDFYDSKINNTILVWVNEDKIIQFKLQQECEKNLHKWDWGLLNSQNPKGEETYFNYSTNVLVNIVNKNAKNPDKIPMVVYAFCNDLITRYENKGLKFLDIPDLANKLISCLSDKSFKPINLAILVQNICKE